MKSEHEKLQFVVYEKLLSNILDLCRRNGIDAQQQLSDATFMTIMQEMLGKVKCKLFAVITCYGQLPLQLTLGSQQLTFGQRVLH